MAKKQGFELEFADSFYYLGFTLTIASLLASLDPLHPRAEADPKVVLHFFGLGMFTTLVGVTGRTVLQMFYRTPDESIEATNRRIAVAAQDFLQRLEELVARADDALESTLRVFDTHIRRRSDEAGTAFTEIVGQLKRAGSELNGFHIDGSRIEVALGEVTQTIGDASRRATKSLTIAGDASERLAQISQAASDATRGAAESVGQAVTQLAVHVDGAAAAAELLNRQLERIGTAPDRLERAVAGVGQVVESLAKRLGEQFGATVSGASLLAGSLTELNRQMSGYRSWPADDEELGRGPRTSDDVERLQPDARVLANLRLLTVPAGAKRLNEVLTKSSRQLGEAGRNPVTRWTSAAS